MDPRVLALALATATLLGCTPGPAEPPASPSATTGPVPTTPGPAPGETVLATGSAPDAPTTRAPVPCPEGEAAVDSVTWTEAEGGTSLAITPSSSLRACAGPLLRWPSEPPGWAWVVSVAGPEAGSAAMRQQYACHLRFARAKDVWHLEPWRPVVGEEQLLADRCNPSVP